MCLKTGYLGLELGSGVSDFIGHSGVRLLLLFCLLLLSLLSLLCFIVLLALLLLVRPRRSEHLRRQGPSAANRSNNTSNKKSYT